jgi:hypothetical protein
MRRRWRDHPIDASGQRHHHSQPGRRVEELDLVDWCVTAQVDGSEDE